MNGKDLEESGGGLIRVLFWNLPKGTEENHEKHKTLDQDSRHPGRDSNREPLEYNSRALPLR
jgi:hypothetical protein